MWEVLVLEFLRSACHLEPVERACDRLPLARPGLVVVCMRGRPAEIAVVRGVHNVRVEGYL